MDCCQAMTEPKKDKGISGNFPANFNARYPSDLKQQTELV